MIPQFPALYTDHLIAMMVILVLIAGLTRRLTLTRILYIAFNSAVVWLAGGFIKYYFWLPRPFLLTGELPRINYGMDGSFPSNHAVLAFAIAFSVLKFRRRLGLTLLGVAILVGLGRIQAGVHTWLDVTGAVVLSGLWVYLSGKFLFRRFSD